ncbi:hypothetical protein [Altererythrobacter sp. BO-6]|nr:hypothetical protein [Altererythrobacter sp. BO-6]
MAAYSTMPNAGVFGFRHLKQYICPGWHGRFAALRCVPHHA